MAEEQSLNDDLDSFADALRSLTVRPAESERLKFEVWRATTERRLSAARDSLRLWKLATGLSSLMALTFAGLWFAHLMSPSFALAPKTERMARVSEQVGVQAVAPQSREIEFGTATESSTGDFTATYISQRNRALAEGIESLPLPQVSGGENRAIPRTQREILESIRDSQEIGG